MIEKALTSADVEFVTTLHGDEQVAFHVLLQPRGDQADRLLRAIDDIALGELDEAARERETPEGDAAKGPAEQALAVSLTALRAAGSTAEGRMVEDQTRGPRRQQVGVVRGAGVYVLYPTHNG
ncbi:indole-3-glycerol phosphate synthase, partial [Streptomyces sp. NPDC127079]|uniref:indole-3-glycerol phosphate synthase n=1 Tax=Streptomyces sp. NPDC127079 TaxID=3347132 RepID=UPI0036471A5F